MMRVQQQPAYILHHRPFRDSSQIIDVLTRDHGRLSLMSRGSRSARSHNKASLQVFTPLLLGWAGRGELPTITSVDLQQSSGPGKPLRLSGKALPSAFYVNELLVRLLHKHDVHEGIYHLYASVIGLLGQGEQIEPVLRLFEKQLLEALGFGLNLNSNADTGEPLQADEEYAYYLEHGPVSFSTVKDELFITRLRGQSLLDLYHNQLQTEQSLKDAKRLMRSILNYYLQGKPLKSRELFR